MRDDRIPDHVARVGIIEQLVASLGHHATSLVDYDSGYAK
jgi:hypothetical protein